LSEPPNSPSRARRSVGLRFLQGIATAVTVLGVVLALTDFGPAAHIDIVVASGEVPFGWFVVVAAAVLWTIYVIGQLGIVLRPTALGIKPSVEEEKVDDQRVGQWAASLKTEQRAYLLDLICSPKTSIRRITDSVKFENRGFEVESTLVIDELPTERQSRYVIPVHWQQKSTPIDGLRVTGDDGKRISTISSVDANAILISLADELAAQIVTRLSLQPADLDVLKQLPRDVVVEAPRESLRRFVAELEMSGGSVESIIRDHTKDDDVAKYTILVGRLTENFPILVAVPAVNNLGATAKANDDGLLRTTRRISVRHVERDIAVLRAEGSTKARRFVSRIEHWLEGALFVETTKATTAIGNADRARSYHLLVHSPDGHYYHHMRLGRIVRDSVAGEAPLVEPMASAAEIDVSEPKLQPFGHLHLRNASETAGHHAVITFRERLPGSVAEAVLASGLLTLLTTSVYVAHGGTFQGVFAAVVPVVFASILTGVTWRTANQLGQTYGGRLASRLASLSTSVLAIVAVIQSSKDAAANAGCVADCTIDTPVWVWLVAAAFATFVFTAGTWIVDLLVERRLARPAAGGAAVRLSSNVSEEDG